MLGFVILIGTVVNNPILIVYESLHLVRKRIRPIFMTTLTTVLGLLPLILFPSAGSELYRGLGVVLLGGLLVSTLVTLVLVPLLLSLCLTAEESIKNFGSDCLLYLSATARHQALQSAGMAEKQCD